MDRAIDLLEALAAHPGGATLAEVAGAVDTSKSAVFATLQTLAARGLVHSTGQTTDRRYRLGLELTRLGDLALAGTTLRDAALPVLHELSAATGLTARAAAWTDEAAVAVAQVGASQGFRFDLHLGSRELLHCSSVGKAMLSVLDDDEALAVLRRIELVRRTSHTLVDAEAILADLHRSRERGWALDDEEDAEGILCIGAPVLDVRGRLAGAVSITRIKSGVGPDAVAALGAIVRDHALEVSRSMGYRVDDRPPASD